MSTCSRTGCTKTLRSNNTKGVCGSGCESPEAPAYQRLGGTAPKREALPASDSLVKFRLVAEALGKDPDALLAEFAQEWLSHLGTLLEDAE